MTRNPSPAPSRRARRPAALDAKQKLRTRVADAGQEPESRVHGLLVRDRAGIRLLLTAPSGVAGDG